MLASLMYGLALTDRVRGMNMSLHLYSNSRSDCKSQARIKDKWGACEVLEWNIRL
jgi:hypothetical protein